MDIDLGGAVTVVGVMGLSTSMESFIVCSVQTQGERLRRAMGMSTTLCGVVTCDVLKKLTQVPVTHPVAIVIACDSMTERSAVRRWIQQHYLVQLREGHLNVMETW